MDHKLVCTSTMRRPRVAVADPGTSKGCACGAGEVLNTGWDIWRATRSANGFGRPARIDELSSDGNDGHVALSADGLTIYFGSSRTGTSGADDIYIATRASAGDQFGTPVRVAEVNSTAMDEPSWISDDSCLLYLFSNRGGNYDLYIASRPRP